MTQAFGNGFFGRTSCLFVFAGKFNTKHEVQKHKERMLFLQIFFWKFRITAMEGCCRQV